MTNMKEVMINSILKGMASLSITALVGMAIFTPYPHSGKPVLDEQYYIEKAVKEYAKPCKIDTNDLCAYKPVDSLRLNMIKSWDIWGVELNSGDTVYYPEEIYYCPECLGYGWGDIEERIGEHEAEWRDYEDSTIYNMAMPLIIERCQHGHLLLTMED